MKARYPVLSLILLILLYLFNSCTTSSSFFYPGLRYVSDTIARRTIQTVKIGDQIWSAQNLDVDRYRNGDTIPQVQDPIEWIELKTGAWCFFMNNQLIDRSVGKLYNWYAINDSRGLAPEGWQIPTDKDWNILTEFLGGSKVAGDKMKETGITHWLKSNKRATNLSGFTAIPNGMRGNNGNFFYADGACFWSNTSTSNLKARGRFAPAQSPNHISGANKAERRNYYKNAGLAVRLICSNDACKPISYMTSLSKDQGKYGKIEPVKIGSQVWMNRNLEVEQYRNGDTIQQVQDPDQWKKLKTGAWCYNIHVCKYGFQVSKLYNWYAVNDPRGLAPEGYHIPTKDEWATLIDFLGGEAVSGGKLKETGNDHWQRSNEAATNESGFTAIPYGTRLGSGGFYYTLSRAVFWSSSSCSESVAYYYTVENHSMHVDKNHTGNKKQGFSVRCVADHVK